MSRDSRAFIAGLAAGVVVVVALFMLVAPLRDLLPSGDESRTDQARQIIEDSYFRSTEGSKLEDASIDAMVRTISKSNEDKFSHYFDPATYRRFQASTSGEFSGIGLSVGDDKRGLRVSQVFKDTPAQRAGIATGDLIVQVSGESIAGISSTEAASRIKGPPGTTVAITVVDGETGKRHKLEVERANVKIPAVAAKMKRVDGDKIGYVRLSTFSRGAHAELRTAIDGLDERGAEGLVFDLRGNGGGLVDEAVLVASIFQEDGPIVTIEGRARDKQTLDATGGALDPGPLVILVDHNTASASEIVTAALKENDLATVIGTRTFGKGVFQEVIELDGGGALDITVGEYLTADGTSILGKGVVPDRHLADKDLSDGDAVLDAGLAKVASELGGS
ncbi:MAG: S41 family peptidase [Solirubrobacterales bacterium]|nr:S41 family peptidase [Solirubrobacterales bacterium]